MQVRFIAQPQDNIQLGNLLTESLKSIKAINAVTIVSAFASLATITRLKAPLIALHEAEAKVRLVLGIDMGGTSKEVLEEIGKWPVEVFIFKNRKSGVTFHPKIYLVEKKTSAEIFVGSNNLTEGGLFKNYEGAALVSYALPEDGEAFTRSKTELAKFLDPQLPVGKRLDAEFLQKLLLRNDIPRDADARTRAKAAKVGSTNGQEGDNPFGFEATPGAKALPIEFQDVVLAANAKQLSDIKKANKETKKKGGKSPTAGQIALPDVEPLAYVPAGAFYMELNATKGTKAEKGAKKNIPGEQRIPLPAIWSAQEFWGWKGNYEREVNPRKSKKPGVPGEKSVDRVYHNWRPVWEISQIGDATRHIPKKTVRMYFYENSSDFRFTCGEIAKWGEPGDIVRIEKVDNGVVDFKCDLAKQGTKEHAEWSKICKASGHTKRGFGFS